MGVWAHRTRAEKHWPIGIQLTQLQVNLQPHFSWEEVFIHVQTYLNPTYTDMWKPSTVYNPQSVLRSLQVRYQLELEACRDYRQSHQKRQPGKILSKTGPLTYTVQVGTYMVWRRHIDHLLDATAARVKSYQNTAENADFAMPRRVRPHNTRGFLNSH